MPRRSTYRHAKPRMSKLAQAVAKLAPPPIRAASLQPPHLGEGPWPRQVHRAAHAVRVAQLLHACAWGGPWAWGTSERLNTAWRTLIKAKRAHRKAVRLL